MSGATSTSRRIGDKSAGALPQLVALARVTCVDVGVRAVPRDSLDFDLWVEERFAVHRSPPVAWD